MPVLWRLVLIRLMQLSLAMVRIVHVLVDASQKQFNDSEVEIDIRPMHDTRQVAFERVDYVSPLRISVHVVESAKELRCPCIISDLSKHNTNLCYSARYGVSGPVKSSNSELTHLPNMEWYFPLI